MPSTPTLSPYFNARATVVSPPPVTGIPGSASLISSTPGSSAQLKMCIRDRAPAEHPVHSKKHGGGVGTAARHTCCHRYMFIQRNDNTFLNCKLPDPVSYTHLDVYKSQLWFTPILSVLMYLGISLCERTPGIWNTGVEVTRENKERIYRILKNMIVTMKLVVVFTFVFLSFYSCLLYTSSGCPLI